MSDYPPIQQFRIFDPAARKFVYSGGTPAMLATFFHQTAPVHTIHKMPYQRSTFLKDKNGKEVYEGDVVLCDRDERCPHEVIWVEDNGGTFLGGMPGFNLKGLNRNGGSGYAWSGNEEIIGNIYENPELLQ